MPMVTMKLDGPLPESDRWDRRLSLASASLNFLSR